MPHPYTHVHQHNEPHDMKPDSLSGHDNVGSGLENRHTQAENIGRLAISTLKDLGCEVELVTLALESIVDNDRVLKRRRAWPSRCHAEVTNFEAPEARNEDIFWLDIQMDESGRVDEMQSLLRSIKLAQKDRDASHSTHSTQLCQNPPHTTFIELRIYTSIRQQEVREVAKRT